MVKIINVNDKEFFIKVKENDYKNNKELFDKFFKEPTKMTEEEYKEISKFLIYSGDGGSKIIFNLEKEEELEEQGQYDDETIFVYRIFLNKELNVGIECFIVYV